MAALPKFEATAATGGVRSEPEIDQPADPDPLAAWNNGQSKRAVVDFASRIAELSHAGSRFGALTHRTDTDCERSGQRDSQSDRIDRGLGKAAEGIWVFVEMMGDRIAE